MASLTDTELHQLLNFIGYGRLDAPIWFIGMEERAEDKDDSIERNIHYRLKFEPEMDLAMGQCALGCKFNKLTGLPTQTWRWMARIALSLTQPNYTWCDLQVETDYVLKRSDGLGRKEINSNTLLMDISPLPAPGIKDWPNYYHALYPDRPCYWSDKKMWEKRQQKFHNLIDENHKTLRYVFAYGSTYRKWYKKMLSNVENWYPLEDTSIEWAKFGDTIAVLTPFFGSRNGLRKQDALKLLNHLKQLKT